MSAPVQDIDFRNLLDSWPEMAMVLIYDNYYDKLVRVADVYTPDRQSSEDTLQDVFASIWRRRQEISKNADESFEHYLVKAIQYHATSVYHRRIRMMRAQKEYYYSTCDDVAESTTDSKSIVEEKRTLLKLIIATFPTRERECLSMRLEGLSRREMARRLGITIKAVERTLTRAKKRLKEFGLRFRR